VENEWAILYLEQKLVTSLLAKFVLLLEIMVWGEFEATRDVLPNKFDNPLTSDFRKALSQAIW